MMDGDGDDDDDTGHHDGEGGSTCSRKKWRPARLTESASCKIGKLGFLQGQSHEIFHYF